MQWFVKILLPGFLFIFPLVSYAQGMKTEVQMGGPKMQQYIQVEGQVSQGLPDFLSKIQNAGIQLKKGKAAESLSSLNEAKADLENIMKVLGEDKAYQEIKNNFATVDDSLKNAIEALQGGKRKMATQAIAKAYRYGKALSESPTLKLTSTMVSLDVASQYIQNKNYSSAGTFLNRAIDTLGQIENNPKIDMKEVQNLKNDIVLLHQQVVLGKLADEKPIKTVYDRMAIANTNMLYQYYDMWSKNDVVWEQY